MVCRWCSKSFAARAGARYCSVACRVAAHRAAPPPEMMAVRRWIRHEAKRPITVSGGSASVAYDATWATYDAAASSVAGDGLGFVLGDGFAAIDLDHCLIDGRLESWAEPIVAAARGTYMEISISGTGLHIFGFGWLDRGRRLGNVELYSSGRYMTVSMRRFRRAPLRLLPLDSAFSVALEEI